MNLRKTLLMATFIFAFLFGFKGVNAASVALSTSASNVIAGNTFKVNVSISSDVAAWDFSIGYDNSKLRVVSSNMESGLHSASVAGMHSRNYTLTFKALSTGSANIYVSDAALYNSKEEALSAKNGTVTVNITTQEIIEKSYSSNNDLESLSIDDVKISPSFSKNVTSYKAEVDPDTTSINVNAKAADSKARVTGNGKREVTEGDNNIVIVVTAENGSEKKYSINVNVKEYDPIKIKVNNQEYTVVRSKLPSLNGYKETTIKIDGEEVPALKSDVTGYTLVALKDSKGNQNFYIKEKDTYTLYKEYTFNKVKIYPLKWNKKDIPKNYKKTTITYDDDKIEAYKLNKSSNYALIYGINVETGEKHIYQYDKNEDTLQIYNDESLKDTEVENKTYLKLAIGSIVLSGVLFIVIIGMLINNYRKNKVKVKMMK